MNIKELYYLVAVAETEHFGNAAKKCFVSQPTLSVQLRKLEDELNVQLFERNNKQVLITPAGRLLVEQSKKILSEIKIMKEMAQNISNPFSGTLRIGIIPTLGPYLLPCILQKIKNKFPQLEIFITEKKTETIVQELLSGKLDTIILALPSEGHGIETQLLFEEPFHLALPTQHTLAAKKSITLDDLKNETLLLLEEGHCLRDQALAVCPSTKTIDKNDFSATSLETLRHLVAINAGITLLPGLSLKAAQQDNNIMIKAFKNPSPSRKIGMQWRESSPQKCCYQAIASLIEQEIQFN